MRQFHLFLSIFFLLIFQTAVGAPLIQSGDIESIKEPVSPSIKGSTLYISGLIDSHIYDYLAWGSEDLKNVTKVSLNSLGGDSNWALEIGRKIRSLGLDTSVEEGSFCASACIYILGSGVHRSMHEDVWLGIHGARLGGGVFANIASACVERISKSEELNFNFDLPECKLVVDKWYKIAKETTDASFDLLESAGVLEGLRTTYYSLEEVKDWFKEGNILKTRDWILSPEVAKDFLLVHQIIRDN